MGIELTRPREHLSTPSARRCRLLCVKYYFSHCRCAVYHSQTELLVASLPFSPVLSLRTLQRWPNGGSTRQGWGNRFLKSSRRPSSYQEIWSRYTSGGSWTIYIKSLHTRSPYFPSLRKANHFLLREDFRPVSPSYGCCDCLNNIIVPCGFLTRTSRLFFLFVRT